MGDSTNVVHATVATSNVRVAWASHLSLASFVFRLDPWFLLKQCFILTGIVLAAAFDMS